jgi:spore coat protein A
MTTSRRVFLEHSLISLAGAAATSSLHGLAQARIKGSPQSSGSWSVETDAVLFDQAWALRFSNALPNPLDPKLLGIGFIYRPDPGTNSDYTVAAGQIQWDILGIGKTTTVWGYGNGEGGSKLLPFTYTYPGRSFVVQRDVAINVRWLNRLSDSRGRPLPHLLPVDQTVALQSVNTGVPTAVHHHGGDTAAEFDGGPDQWQTPVRQQTGPGVSGANSPGDDGLSYSYLNAQEASMHWYHDHAEGVTRINAYAGLAGLYVIRDNNEANLIARLSIPSGPYEVPLLLQDKLFTADANMAYFADPAQYPQVLDPSYNPRNPTHMPEVFGDIVVVNGKAWPNLDVEPREYRLRLLNGADARFFVLNFGAAPVWQIGTDLGLLNAPVVLTGGVTIAPGERIDLVVDFSALAGKQLVVTNSGAVPFPNGLQPPADSGTDVVMRFSVNPLPSSAPLTRVKGVKELRGQAPDTPKLDVPAKEAPGATVRRILLGEGTDEYNRITPLLGTYDPSGRHNIGTMGFNEPATEDPRLGSTEIWEFWNTTVDSHPVHMHLVQFRILDRQAFVGSTAATVMLKGWKGVQLLPGARKRGVVSKAQAQEQGWKDTVVCPPGMVTRVITTFNRAGKYVYHCHILSHEEHDMMRWFVVS